jgi:hypothetical protein
LKLDWSTTECKFKPRPRVALELGENVVANFVVVSKLEGDLCPIRVKLVNRVELAVVSTHADGDVTKCSHLVCKLILACTAHHGKHLEDGNYQRWIAHQGGEGHDEPIEVFGGDVSSLLDAVRAKYE